MLTIRSFSISVACEQSEPRKNARASSEAARPPHSLSRLLSRVSRASNFRNIPQMESLLAG